MRFQQVFLCGERGKGTGPYYEPPHSVGSVKGPIPTPAREIGRALTRPDATWQIRFEMNDPDLKPWLDAWPYDPENAVRVVKIADGREVIQVRRPLGIDQFEVNGRPDGARPHGMESWLHFYLEKKKQAAREPLFETFRLSHEDFERLREEAVLYYFRYVLFFQLEDYAHVVRDTERNLRVLDLVRDHAEEHDDAAAMEVYRPYILRMNGMAKAMLFSGAGDLDSAERALQESIRKIRDLQEIDQEEFDIERKRSLALLQGAIDEIRRSRPMSELERLEQELREAIEAERYEDAARIRDRIQLVRRTDGS